MKVINKPWGREEIIENNDKYVVKRLTMNEGQRCSLQYHEFKKETIYVLSGLLKIYIDKDSKIYERGDYVTINPGVIHRMEGISKSVYLESSTNELDDVIRIEDDYERK